jgi:hypothetical protein
MKTGSQKILAFLLAFLLYACAGSRDTAPLPLAASQEAVAPATTHTIAQQLDTLSPSTTPTTTQAGSPSISSTAAAAESPSPTPTTGAVKYPCHSIFFPLVAKTTWVYREINASGSKILKIYAQSVEGSSASISLWDLSSLARSDITVTCQDGAISRLSLFEAGFLFLPRNGKFQMQSTSGLITPSEAALEAADWDFSWNADLDVSGSFLVVDRETSAIYSITVPESTIRIEWRTAGAGDEARESVTVDYDTYPRAVKVFMNASFAILLSTDEANQNVPATLEISGTLWFEPYVGLVKLTMDTSDILWNGTTLSVDMGSSLELTRFTPPK